MSTQIHNLTLKRVYESTKANNLDLVQIMGKNSVESHLSECKRNAYSTELSRRKWELSENRCKLKATIVTNSKNFSLIVFYIDLRYI